MQRAVKVVEKKGKFDEEVTEWADRLDGVETADEFLEFYDDLIADIEEKSYEFGDRQFERYVSELTDWLEGLGVETMNLEDDEWEILYETVFDLFDDEYGLFEDWLEKFEKAYEAYEW